MSDTSSQSSRVNPAAIIAMTVIACVGIAGAVVLIVTGHSVGDLLAVLAVVAVPVLTLFGGHIYQKLDEVKSISNGNTAAMRDAMIQWVQAQQAASNTPPVVVVNPIVPPDPPAVS